MLKTFYSLFLSLSLLFFFVFTYACGMIMIKEKGQWHIHEYDSIMKNKHVNISIMSENFK